MANFHKNGQLTGVEVVNHHDTLVLRVYIGRTRYLLQQGSALYEAIKAEVAKLTMVRGRVEFQVGSKLYRIDKYISRVNELTVYQLHQAVK